MSFPACDNEMCLHHSEGDCTCMDLSMSIQQDYPPIVICKSVKPIESEEKETEVDKIMKLFDKEPPQVIIYDGDLIK